jgi:preprotein translocase subunit SecG
MRGGFGGPIGGPGGMRGGFGGPVGGFGDITPPPPRRRNGCAGCGTLFGAVLVVLIAIVICVVSSCSIGHSGSSGSTAASTIVREKLDTGNAYITDCIIDEIGWFDNVSKTESQLKNFWEKTGVQPYIILKAYDPSLTTNSEKEAWAENYYDENFDTENIFLYVYFTDKDAENVVGYMAYAGGYQTSSVMDSEALEIFWNNIDRYWYTDLSTDEVFVKVFDDTADTIMHVSTTGKDILKWVLIVIAILLIGGIIVTLVKQKNKRAKEKAEEDQKILNTPIHDLAKDNLEDKYL